MNTELRTKTNAEKISDCVRSFTRLHFDQALSNYADNLVIHIQKNWQLNIFKGRAEQWAAAVVYVLARFNLLFAEMTENGINPETIFRHFPESPEEIRKRARKIENACGFELGEPSISSDRVRSMINLFTTQSGFVIPKFSIEGYIEYLVNKDKTEARWAEKKVEELIRARKARYMEKQLQISLKKGMAVSDQMELFTK